MSGQPTSLILIVEDNEKNLKLVRDILNAKGYETMEAGTAEDGIVLAENRRPDLVLMDIQLPGIDGHEATRRIKAVPSLAHTPVIAVTSYALAGDDRKAAEAGCDDYITKPYSPRALLARVREFLETVRRSLGQA